MTFAAIRTYHSWRHVTPYSRRMGKAIWGGHPGYHAGHGMRGDWMRDGLVVDAGYCLDRPSDMPVGVTLEVESYKDLDKRMCVDRRVVLATQCIDPDDCQRMIQGRRVVASVARVEA